MTIPPLDATYPLHAAPLPASRLPAQGSEQTPALLIALVKQALHLIRSTEAWKKGKQFCPDDPLTGGKVQALYCPSDMEGRLKKCGWHARLSRHKPSLTGLSFEDMFEGLGTDRHTLNEQQYIHDLVEAKKVSTVVPQRAEVWLNSYHLPSVTSNRDFLELVITLPLPPSPAPFTSGHEEAIINTLASSSNDLPSHPGAEGTGLRRSFIIISIPVEHADAPDQPSFVRAKYASVEAVWETQIRKGSPAEDGTGHKTPDIEWLMMVQSDSSGKIPLMFQEMAMAGKIAQDVPSFFHWAHQQKTQRGGSLPPSASAQNNQSSSGATASSAAPAAAAGGATGAAASQATLDSSTKTPGVDSSVDHPAQSQASTEPSLAGQVEQYAANPQASGL